MLTPPRWDKMGSSSLNDKPDTDEVKAKGYTPQYAVTGQGLRYRVSADGGGDDAKSARPLGGVCRSGAVRGPGRVRTHFS
jgi:hypothetical protein